MEPRAVAISRAKAPHQLVTGIPSGIPGILFLGE